jgi:hypothetical protein
MGTPIRRTRASTAEKRTENIREGPVQLFCIKRVQSHGIETVAGTIKINKQGTPYIYSAHHSPALSMLRVGRDAFLTRALAVTAAKAQLAVEIRRLQHHEQELRKLRKTLK